MGWEESNTGPEKVLSWLWLNAVAICQEEFGHPGYVQRGTTLNLHTISSNLCLALTYDQGNVRLALRQIWKIFRIICSDKTTEIFTDNLNVQRNTEHYHFVSKSLERSHNPWFAFKTPHISKFSWACSTSWFSHMFRAEETQNWVNTQHMMYIA